MRLIPTLAAAGALAFAAMLVTLPGSAQDTEADMQVLVEAMQLGAVMDQMDDLMVDPIAQAISQQHPGQSALIREVTEEVVQEVLQEQIPALEEAVVALYTEMFTQQELNDIIAFYQTPTGQRLLETMPALTQRGMQMGQQWGQQIGPIVVERLQARLAEEGIEVQP